MEIKPINLYELKVVNSNPLTGVLYIGQYGTSGYAQAAKGYLFNYFSRGIPITWEPLYFDDSKLNNEDIYDIVIKSLIYKDICNYNVVIIHSTPDLWPSLWNDRKSKLEGRSIYGYCTWETSSLPKSWVECINSRVHEVWCPSQYNKVTFKDSGVSIPIKVVPHIFLPKRLPSKNTIEMIDSISGKKVNLIDKYTFYSIGEFNARKSMSELIHTYCKTFTNKDKVRLIIKTHYKSYNDKCKQYCKTLISDILNQYDNYPEIIVLLNNMSNDEILALHSLGDCYISLTKSEGFGLTIFDAFNYKKKIIVTKGGGHLDFLGLNYEGLIDAKIGKVEGMGSFSNIYNSEHDTIQEWFIPNLECASELMKKYYKKQVI